MGEFGIKFHDPSLTDTAIGEAQGQSGEATLTIPASVLSAADYVIEIFPIG